MMRDMIFGSVAFHQSERPAGDGRFAGCSLLRTFVLTKTVNSIVKKEVMYASCLA
jgi:hypothetical protein